MVSGSYREINQHPSLPWNFVTHGFLHPSALPDLFPRSFSMHVMFLRGGVVLRFLARGRFGEEDAQKGEEKPSDLKLIGSVARAGEGMPSERWSDLPGLGSWF